LLKKSKKNTAAAPGKNKFYLYHKKLYTMQYEEKLLELIFSEDSDALINWISSHPDLEQVDIFRELKELTQKMMAETEQSEEAQALCAGLEEKTAAYEEACLDEQVASLQLDLVHAEMDKQLDKMEETVEGIKEYIRECIETGAPNAAEMKELAAKIIASEKEHGLYDPGKWLWYRE
jgi:hypothetical protein